MNKDTQLIWEASPLPEPKPRGVTIQQPSLKKLDANNFLNFHTALGNFIKDNKLKVKSLGDGGGIKSLNPFTSSKAAKNWLEISNKLLLEKVSTDDISGWDPSASVTDPFIPEIPGVVSAESEKWAETRKKLAAAKQRFGKNEQYISLYKADFFGDQDIDQTGKVEPVTYFNKMDARAEPRKSTLVKDSRKGGLTNNQLKDIIENAPESEFSISEFDQKEVIHKLKQVAIIKMGIEPVDEAAGNFGRREKSLAGSYKIELVYADEDSTPPLNDLYDSTIPLEIKRFINETLSNEKSKFKEGEKSETSSLTRSRSSSLIEKAKQENIEKYGALTCTKCGIQPAIDYYQKNQKVSPSLASKIIEGHHIHGVRETEQATTEDIEILCTNCHIYETRISN